MDTLACFHFTAQNMFFHHPHHEYVSFNWHVPQSYQEYIFQCFSPKRCEDQPGQKTSARKTLLSQFRSDERDGFFDVLPYNPLSHTSYESNLITALDADPRESSLKKDEFLHNDYISTTRDDDFLFELSCRRGRKKFDFTTAHADESKISRGSR